MRSTSRSTRATSSCWWTASTGSTRRTSAERVDNAAYDLVFVPYPEPYSMFHNSNQVVAGWLEQLGCRVEGTTLLSVWQLGAD